ncbi:hypothetical protein V6R21_05835 [Limibacter armeniacum]|uniref:hypothetical protein n=1 Tax=Limibacter armeniacum TaxID=466084 RepID=UPI002FE57DD8
MTRQKRHANDQKGIGKPNINRDKARNTVATTIKVSHAGTGFGQNTGLSNYFEKTLHAFCLHFVYNKYRTFPVGVASV